jgi:O-acetyl-ADP-ribose deacetylase (regulator of RNase III)
MTKISIHKGDITTYRVDAIVNAANSDLILGGGLAGAIRAKGGPDIQAECDRHGPVEVGQAAITGAGRLPARHVIHQASMALGGYTTAESLRQSTAAVLALAKESGIKTLAFPATGSGIGGMDTETCAKIMLEEVARHLSGETSLTHVTFVLLDDQAYQTFRQVMKGMNQAHE